MSVRAWALKIGELKPLSRQGVLLLGVRCALRAEPWCPPGSRDLWERSLTSALDAAFSAPRAASDHAALRRDLSDGGARACNRLEPTDEPFGRCMSYATQTLCAVFDASELPMGADLKKSVIYAAKLSASIPAVLAHAGRVVPPAGVDAVDHASLTVWSAIRADLPVLAREADAVREARDRVRALREVGPSWPGGAPEWAKPARTAGA